MRLNSILIAMLLSTIFVLPMPCESQQYPPQNLKQIQVQPRIFTGGEVLKPGFYNVWVRIGNYETGTESGTNNVTPYRGGIWTKATNIDFTKGGPPRHVTVFPDMLNPFHYTDFNDPHYGAPNPNDFIIHINNSSIKDTVTYVFEPISGVGGTRADPDPTTSSACGVAGTWLLSFQGAMVLKAVMTLQQSGNIVTGSWPPPDNSNPHVEGKLEGQTLKLKRITGRETDQYYQVTVDGDRFSGTYWNVGKYPGSGTFTGERRR